MSTTHDNQQKANWRMRSGCGVKTTLLAATDLDLDLALDLSLRGCVGINTFARLAPGPAPQAPQWLSQI